MRMRTILIALAIVGGFVYFTTSPNTPFHRAGGPLWTGPAKAAGLGADEVNNIDIYKTAQNSVAYITSTVYQQTFFFEVVPTRALGSGFLISDDGRILTNNHVISGSAKIEVRFSDGSRYTAKTLVADVGAVDHFLHEDDGAPGVVMGVVSKAPPSLMDRSTTTAPGCMKDRCARVAIRGAKSSPRSP